MDGSGGSDFCSKSSFHCAIGTAQYAYIRNLIYSLFGLSDMKNYFLYLVLLLSFPAAAQYSGGGRPAASGHLYGKVIDSIAGKPLEYAVVEVLGYKYDTVAHSGKQALLTGDLCKANGDFSLENLPLNIVLTIKVQALGYETSMRSFQFKIDFQQMMKQRGSGGSMDGSSSASGMLNMTDKDIGNIRLKPSANTLKGVVIESDRPDVEIKLDKKVYNIEKNLTITGGTAEDALKTIPSITVDLDGNVSMRNASPQIFVDGRPSTLTIDQIPADAIESVEVISNPSAKYDASGGMAGIINIVLKKNRKTGYNGSIRLGVDMRGKINSGVDLNVREGKWNVFVSGGIHQRESIGLSITDRNNLVGHPLTNMVQNDPTAMNGFFGFGRAGFDYFMSNRNTITVSGNYGLAHFLSTDQLDTHLDTLYPGFVHTSRNLRDAASTRQFQSLGTSVLFKHLFPREGRELTADVNYNSNGGTTSGLYNTTFYDMNNMSYRSAVQQLQQGASTSQFITAQSDFQTPMGKNIKLETGIRASIKNYTSSNSSFLLNPSNNEYQELKAFGVNYSFTDQVYAVYSTLGQEFKKFSYQAGVRVESSLYAGQFTDSTVKYQYTYPVIPFPSLFATYHLNDKNDIQLSYSRRINRPSFFQLIPATDYSDSLNIKRGNPALRPEFTNSIELSYLKQFSRSNTLMVTGYYKHSTDLITNYQVSEQDPVLHHRVILNTYENALSSNSWGGEITAKASIKKILEFTANLNLYYTVINATNVDSGLINKRFNWFARLNATYHITKVLSLQASAEYTAKSNLPLNSGGGGGRWGGMGGGFGGGGMGGFGAGGATAQGYSLPVYYIDAGLKYEFLKDRKASLTLNAADILKSRIVQTHSESTFFIQDTSRRKDQLFFRLTFSYRFGKFDVSLFKRKNTKTNADGMQDMQM
jgi:outer membrane receptor protein involved in Fe transport